MSLDTIASSSHGLSMLIHSFNYLFSLIMAAVLNLPPPQHSEPQHVNTLNTLLIADFSLS
jgi:hypothetical protein